MSTFSIRLTNAEALKEGPTEYLVLITGRDKVYVILSKEGHTFPMTYCFNTIETAQKFASTVEELFPELICAIYRKVKEGKK